MQADIEYYKKPYEIEYTPEEIPEKVAANKITYVYSRKRAYEMFSRTREQLLEDLKSRQLEISNFLAAQKGRVY